MWPRRPGCRRLAGRDRRDELFRQPIASSDHREADSVLLQLHLLGLEVIAEELKESLDLPLRPFPVVGRERKEGQRRDPERRPAPHAPAHHPSAASVTPGAFSSLHSRPPPLTLPSNPDMQHFPLL